MPTPVPFPPWEWKIPAQLNIGVACTDAHLGTPRADRVAMLVDDATSGSRSVTFAALAERTSRFAGALRALGVAPGERMLVRLPNCLEYPTVFLSGQVDGTRGVFRSTDEGGRWVRVSDDDHEYGTVNVLEGDPRVFGRVYLGPSGRGIVVGEPRAD